MDIGKPKTQIRIEPIESPVPREEESEPQQSAPDPAPLEADELPIPS